MTKHLLFLQGGGSKEDYDADAKLVASLKKTLAAEYQIHYPFLESDESAPDFGRLKQIEKEISRIKGDLVVVAHSLGASMLLKFLSERTPERKIRGVFLIATPFWSGDEDWKQGFILRKDFADKLPEGIPLFFYHSEDDEEVPSDHLEIYARHLPQAKIHRIEKGGHQLNNDLSQVAKDIESI